MPNIDINLLDQNRFSKYLVTALSVTAPRHAEMLDHNIIGTDDVLLALLSPNTDGQHESTSPARLFDDRFDLTLGDVRLAIKVISDRREVWNSTGASKGVNKALREARKIARRRAGGFWFWPKKYSVLRIDVLAGLVKVNDKTFRRLMKEMDVMFVDNFSFEHLREAMEYTEHTPMTKVLVMS